MTLTTLPERAIKLKERSYTTAQGCRVVATWYTSLQGIVTEDVVLSTPKQERRQ